MSQLKKLIHEIHRRSLWQVLGVYLAGSWLALQVVEQLTEAAGLPEWVRPFALVLLVIGFPIVLGTAFVQEGVGRREPTASEESGEPPAAGGGTSETPTPDRPLEKTSRGEPVAAPGGMHRLLTWRNAIAGGVLAFALLGLATAGFLAMRTLGIGPAGTLVAKGLIEQGERVILADFENLTPDSLLSEVVTEALRVDLAETPTISVAEPGHLAEVLRRMERHEEGGVDLDLALEVAIREGIKAVIAGEVGAAGGAYVLTARLLTAANGEELVALRETAEEPSDLVSAIDRLSKRLRERLGESLRTVNASQSLEQVTTGSLDALQKYSQALSALYAGEADTGEALLEEALEIDSTFAMAWRKLATQKSGIEQVEAVTKAYAYRDRLTDRERYHTIALYEFHANADFEEAATVYRTLLDTYPDDWLALYNLSVCYFRLGDLEQVIELAQRSVEAGNPGVSAYVQVVWTNFFLGRAEAARAALARFLEERPDHLASARSEWAMAVHDGDVEAARAAASRFTDSENREWRNRARFDLSVLEASRGRLAAAADLESSRRGVKPLIRAMEYLSRWDLPIRGDTADARRRIDEALEQQSPEELEPPQLWELIRNLARAGQPARARALRAENETRLDSTRLYFPWPPSDRLTEGDLLVAEGRYQEAISEYRAYERWPDCYDRCVLYELARAYDLAGEADSAIAVYGRLVEGPDFGNVFAFSIDLFPPHYRRLGELYEEKGDLENAAKYYAMFVEMWADADEELQPRVRAAQARLEEILAERG